MQKRRSTHKFFSLSLAEQKTPRNLFAMSDAVNTIISLENQCISEIRVRSATNWIGFDKYKKFIYGFVHCNFNLKLQFVAQSVFGGEAILLKQISLDENIRDYFPFTTAMNGEVIAVAPEKIQCKNKIEKIQCIYLFSVPNGPVKKYKMLTKWPNRRAILHKLCYSSLIGFFGLIGLTGYRKDEAILHRFVFDHDKKTCEAILVAKCPLSGFDYWQLAGNNKTFSIFANVAGFLLDYDIRKNIFYEKNWCIMNRNVIVAGLSASSYENEILASFCDYTRIEKSEDSVPIFTHELHKLNDVRCKDLGISYSSTHSSIDMLSTSDTVFIDDKGTECGVFINLNVLSLRDIAFRKVVACWNHGTPYQTFLDSLNLPPEIKREYLARAK